MDRIAAPLVSAGKEKGAGAALIQGGLGIAGDDFVVDRLMGRFQFVPAEEDDEATKTGTGAFHRAGRLDSGGEPAAVWFGADSEEYTRA